MFSLRNITKTIGAVLTLSQPMLQAEVESSASLEVRKLAAEFSSEYPFQQEFTLEYYNAASLPKGLRIDQDFVYPSCNADLRLCQMLANVPNDHPQYKLAQDFISRTQEHVFRETKESKDFLARVNSEHNNLEQSLWPDVFQAEAKYEAGKKRLSQAIYNGDIDTVSSAFKSLEYLKSARSAVPAQTIGFTLAGLSALVGLSFFRLSTKASREIREITTTGSSAEPRVDFDSYATYRPTHQEPYYQAPVQALPTPSIDRPVVAAATHNVSKFNEADFRLAMQELDSLIGLAGVKDQIKKLVAFFRMEEERRMLGQTTEPISTHLVFYGPPGVAKTTVARIVGNIFSSLGFLSQGHFVEGARSKMVAGHLGQTAIKTEELVEEAEGGVLFIDEAYSLNPQRDDKKNSSHDIFAQEAVDTLVKLMEDKRSDLCVIFAGYKPEMQSFIKSNPGLESRFAFHITFEGYSNKELGQIFNVFLKKNNLNLANKKLLSGFDLIIDELRVQRGDSFGNGREVRTIVEKARILQSARIIDLLPYTRRVAMPVLKVEDLPFVEMTGKTHEQLMQSAKDAKRTKKLANASS